MKCDHVATLIPEFIDGSLSRDDMLQLQRHTTHCDACFAQLEETSATLAQLEAWPSEVPSPRLSERFYAMLEAHQQGLDSAVPAPKARFRWWPLLTGISAAAAALILGIFLGRHSGLPALTDNALTSNQQASSLAMNTYLDDVHLLTRRASLSLMDNPAPTQRLDGINYSYRLDGAEPEIMATLLDLVNDDPSEQVRAAAVKALERFHQVPSVRRSLAAVMIREQSPLVLSALIDSTQAMPEVQPSLKSLLLDDNLDPHLRGRVQALLARTRDDTTPFVDTLRYLR